jgi:hypothetical protein
MAGDRSLVDVTHRDGEVVAGGREVNDCGDVIEVDTEYIDPKSDGRPHSGGEQWPSK